MKMVNATLAALFLLAAGCSENSVPELDKAQRALNSGDLPAATIHIRNALRDEGDNPAIRLLSGKIALKNENLELAKAELTLVSEHPTLGKEARLLLAQALAMNGQGRAALAMLARDPLASGTAFAIAVSANAMEDKIAEANRLLDQGLSAYPKSSELLILDGTRAMQKGDLGSARSRADSALALAPSDVDVLLFAAKVAMHQRRLEDSEALLDRALKQRPKSQPALLSKAALAYDRGDLAKAEATLKKAAETLGGLTKPLGLLQAQIAFDQGKYDQANEILQGMGNLSAFSEARLLAGLVAAKRGQREEAIAYLRPYLSQGGEDARARFTLANALWGIGQADEAWRILQPIAEAPNANLATLQLAGHITGQLKLPAAADYQARHARLAKGDPIAKQMIAADRAISSGRWSEAQAIYSALLAKPENANNIMILNNLASVLVRMDRPAEAISHARKAQGLAPANPTIRDTLGWAMFKANGLSPEAVEHLRFAAEAQPGNANIRSHYLALVDAAEKNRKQ